MHEVHLYAKHVNLGYAAQKISEEIFDLNSWFSVVTAIVLFDYCIMVTALLGIG